MMRPLISRVAALSFWIAGLTLSLESRAEPYKGSLSPRIADFSVMTGLGLVDSSAALSVLATASRKIVEQGFVSDLNNQVFAEIALGSGFLKGHSAFVYSTHLRWDFERDSDLRLFALGGLSGTATGSGLGDRWTLTPRFGIGAFLPLSFLSEEFRLRLEVSHDFVGGGLAIRL
jgi:hypothetical protein